MEDRYFDGEILANETIEMLDDGMFRIVGCSKRYKPYYMGKYYYVTEDFKVDYSEWEGHPYDRIRMFNNNVFRTEKEASKRREYEFSKTIFRKEFTEGEENWFICYNFNNKELSKKCTYNNHFAGVEYFESESSLDNLFKSFSEEDVLKWEFGIYK